MYLFNYLLFSGVFIETRSGLINIAPCGRSASAEERDEFEKYDKVRQLKNYSCHL